MNIRRAPLITLEGIEGVGKTTQWRRMVAYLQSHGIAVVATREPGGTPLAEAIRDLVLRPPVITTEPWIPDTELLLFAAARAQHIAQVIQPACAAGQWVICDRFVDATFAYQGGGRQLDLERIAALMDWTCRAWEPNQTFWLDMPVSMAMDRVASRGNRDRMESETYAFFERVQAMYQTRSAQYPHRIRRINGVGSADAVFAQIQPYLDQQITQWQSISALN